MEMELKRGSLNILYNLLQGTQWYNSTKSAYLAGQIVTQVLPEAEESPKDPTAGSAVNDVLLRDWLRKTTKLTFTPAQAKVVAECLLFFLNSKQLPPGEYTLGLMDAFKLAPEKDEE